MKFFTTLFFTVIALGAINGQHSADKRIAHFNVDENQVALEGYDPVSYFTLGQAIKGNEEISHTHLGITYYFFSNSNRDLFLINPGKYEPAYGGWGAHVMAKKGEKQSIDPSAFEVREGRLYLFHKPLFCSNLNRWSRNVDELKPRAEANWAAIMEE